MDEASNLLKTRIGMVVSAAGLEPATHALKEYAARRSLMGIHQQEWRESPVNTRSYRDPAMLTLNDAHYCNL
jgi:hypothetical protein